MDMVWKREQNKATAKQAIETASNGRFGPFESFPGDTWYDDRIVSLYGNIRGNFNVYSNFASDSEDTKVNVTLENLTVEQAVAIAKILGEFNGANGTRKT